MSTPGAAALPAINSGGEGVYQVFSLCFARGRTRRVHDNFMDRDVHDGPMPLDYNVWILRNAHRTVLVDTGFAQPIAVEREKPLDFDPVEALSRLGIDPGAIEDVIISHLHYDHAGNMDRFARARFHVQEAEINFATGRCMCERKPRLAFHIEDIVTLVRHTYADRACLYAGDADLLPGISLHLLPGHSTGMQAVKVMTPRGPIVLASDVTHYFANLLRRAPFAWTSDTEATLRSYDRLLALAGSLDRVIPGHDPKLRSLYPMQRINGVELLALHEPPRPHDVLELSRIDNFQ
ncbi:N-acyl homoserine lactonase family protein [soil metagenome]